MADTLTEIIDRHLTHRNVADPTCRDQLVASLTELIRDANETAWDEGFDFGYDRVLVERAAIEWQTDFRVNPYAQTNDEGIANV